MGAQLLSCSFGAIKGAWKRAGTIALFQKSGFLKAV